MEKETSHTVDYYNRLADQYEQRWKSYLRHTHRQFLDRIHLGPQDKVLDPSCGTGLLAKELIEDNQISFEKLVLNDPSEKMLGIAQNRFSNYPGIEFSHSSTEELAFPDEAFTKILCLNAFHYYPRQEEVCSLFFSLLQPGGKLYLLDWNREGLFKIVNRFIDWWTPEELHTRTKQEAVQLLSETGFSLNRQESWNFRYWNLFFVEAVK